MTWVDGSTPYYLLTLLAGLLTGGVALHRWENRPDDGQRQVDRLARGKRG